MWIVDTDFFIYNNLPTIIGAQAVNSVQTYPDSILWQKLELENKENIWNRYAHLNIRISVKNTGNYLKLQNVDLLRLTVSLHSVKEIGVKYILSNQDIKHVQGLDCLYEFGGYYIYQME